MRFTLRHRMIKIDIAYFLLAIQLVMLGCQSKTEIEIQRNYVIVGEINRVLILGNSITVTRPSIELGWEGHWGMAASAQDKDYVHLLKKKFESYNDSIDIEFASVSFFERNFWDLDLSLVQSFRDFAPDLIIIRLGENVSEEEASNRGFDKHLVKLIDYLKNNRNVAICATSTFWPKDVVNSQIENLSLEEGYIYVPIVDLFNDQTNTAFDQFENEGVRIHPSDKGMENISDRIAEQLGIFED